MQIVDYGVDPAADLVLGGAGYDLAVSESAATKFGGLRPPTRRTGFCDHLGSDVATAGPPISGSACGRSGTAVEVRVAARGARPRRRPRARRRVRLELGRAGSTPCCRPGHVARDPGFARSRRRSGPGTGRAQRPALRRPTPDPERPAPTARPDRARVPPVPRTVATYLHTVARRTPGDGPLHGHGGARQPVPSVALRRNDSIVSS
jgi:hypothetical protein